MYARTTTVHADPQRMDDGITYVRDEVMPAVQTMPGCLGLSMLCDRGSGRCIVTTSWDSQESMSASRDAVRAMRDRAIDVMGGSFDVQEWEIGLLHRAHATPEGAWCRVTWTRGGPARMDDMLSTFRAGILPRVEELPGFCSMSLLMDRQSGMCALTSVYESRDSMQQASGDVAAMREQFSQQMGLDVVEMAEFEVTIHHLRVPEMA